MDDAHALAEEDKRPRWKYHWVPVKRSLLTGNQEDDGPIIFDVENGGVVHPAEFRDDTIDVEFSEAK